jgi:hypothetical protein
MFYFLQSHPRLLSKSLNSNGQQLIAASLTTIDSEEQMRRLKPKAKGSAKSNAKSEIAIEKGKLQTDAEGQKKRRLIHYIAQTTFSTIFSRGKYSLS